VLDEMSGFSIIIQNGLVIDGTGGEAKQTDVGIKGNKITALGDLKDAVARHRIDATGLVVSPGFIDMHSHSDLVLVADGRGESMLRQGVTTNVSGNCGMSVAPLNGPHRDEILRNLSSGMLHGIEVTWGSFGEYRDVLSKAPKAINLAPLVGHGTVRGAAMGFSARHATESEIKKMRDLVRQSMEQGAFGMSSGLIYPPGFYSNAHELIEVAKVVAELDGIYSTHVRSETNLLVEAIEEALSNGKAAQVRTNISHHKAVGRDNWGKVHTTYSMIKQAAKDIELTYDIYPYATCGGSLSQYAPPWAKEGGMGELFRRLADPGQRKRIAYGIVNGDEYFPEFYRVRWEDVQINTIKTKKNAWMEGLRVSEIANRVNKDPVDLIIDLMLEEQDGVPINQHVMSEEDVEFLLQKEEAMIVSDGSAITPGGPTGIGKPHPRSYGAFARFLGYWVRDKNILPLETAIHKVTGKPANTLRLKDRGIIKENFAADIAIFDPERILDRANFDNPHQFAEGVHWVIVNGHITLDNGKVSPELRGRVLSPN
jgi:N-acyl-D-amino-acid deacylase